MTKPSTTTQETREHSPLPWGVHRTGSHIGLLSGDRKYVFRKVVSGCSIEQYNKLSTDLEFIASAVNAPSDTEQVIRLREALEQIAESEHMMTPCATHFARNDNDDAPFECDCPVSIARAALQPKAETELEHGK